MDEKKVIIVKNANTFRIALKEGFINLQFGQNDDGDITPLNSTEFSVNMLMPLIENLIGTAAAYQKEFNFDLGIEVDENSLVETI